MKANLLVGVVAGLLLATTAQAQQLSESLAKMDTDGDGKLSAAEFTADKPTVFKRLDKDKSGGISKEEAAAYYAKFGAADDKKTISRIASITSADKSGDGQTSLEELTASGLADFAKRDSDKDGFVTGADRK